MFIRRRVMGPALAAIALAAGGATAQYAGRSQSDDRGSDPDWRDRQDAGMSGREMSRESSRDDWRSGRSWSSGRDMRGESYGYRDAESGQGEYQPDLRQATRLIGKRVNDAENRHVGHVDDLAVDTDHGVVAYAVIARGGVLGVGERLVPVPFKALRPSQDRSTLVLQTNEAMLDHVPNIRNDDYSVMSDANWARDLFSQFNQQPYWVSGYQGAPGGTFRGMRGSSGREQGRGESDWRDSQSSRGMQQGGSLWSRQSGLGSSTSGSQGGQAARQNQGIYGYRGDEESSSSWDESNRDRAPEDRLSRPRETSGYSGGSSYDQDRDQGQSYGSDWYNRSGRTNRSNMSGRSDSSERRWRMDSDRDSGYGQGYRGSSRNSYDRGDSGQYEGQTYGYRSDSRDYDTQPGRSRYGADDWSGQSSRWNEGSSSGQYRGNYGYTDRDRDREYGLNDEGTAGRWQRSGRHARSTMHTRTANLNGPGEIVKASDLMDEHVRGTGGDRLGRLHDLMVDLNTGSIGYVIVGDNNAFSGKLFAVPWNAFTVRSGRRGEPGLALNISDRDLSNAPSFDRDRWPNLSSRRWTEVVHNYYGVEPTWTYYGYVDSESEAQRFQGSQGRQNLESQQQGSSLFDPQSTRTINGTIESMNRNARLESTGSVVRLEVAISGEGPAAQGTSTPGASTQPGATGRQAGVTTPMGSSGLRAQAGSQVISVFLGPASFLQEQQISLKPGDSITVEGSQVMLRNSPALLATRLTKEGKSIELRDRQGQPLWSRSGQGQQNPMGQESSNLQGSETGTGSNQPGSSGSTGRDASGTSGTGGAATGGTSGSTGTGVGQTPGSTSGGAVGSSAGGTSGAIGNPGTPNPPSGPQATPGQTR